MVVMKIIKDIQHRPSPTGEGKRMRPGDKRTEP
jgi:hypothetical protein